MDFLETKYLYLYLLLFSVAYPLAQSFEWRLRYYRQWKHLLPAIGIMAAVFIPWDIWFTSQGVWWFNEKYTSGARVFLLPIEEWLFFLIVPFACIFIYEVLNYYFKRDFFKPVANVFFILLALFLAGAAIVYSDRLYPFVTFLVTSLALLVTAFFKPEWRGRFLFMYLVSWLPFLLVNGALTGNFTSEAIVNYNPQEFIGWRITTIPVEDSVYNLIMLLMVVAVYESLKGSPTVMLERTR